MRPSRILFLLALFVLIGCARSGVRARAGHRPQHYSFTKETIGQLGGGLSLCRSFAETAEGHPVPFEGLEGHLAAYLKHRKPTEKPRIVRSTPTPLVPTPANSNPMGSFTVPENFALTGAVASQESLAVGEDVRLISGAYGYQHQIAQSCYADGTRFVVLGELDEMYDEGNVEPEAAREHARQFFAAAQRAFQLEGAYLALLASYEGVFEGRVSAKQASKLGGAAAGLVRNPPPAPAEAIERDVAAGREAGRKIDRDSHAWTAGEPDHVRLGLLGLGGASARARRDHRESRAEERQAIASRTHVTASEAGGAQSLSMGILRGDPGSLVRGAALFLPPGSNFRHAIDGLGALASGDVLGALGAAAELLPKDSTVAQLSVTALRTATAVSR